MRSNTAVHRRRAETTVIEETTDERFRRSRPVWWAWLDLNQRPHPYQAYSRDAFMLVERRWPAHGRGDSDRGCPLGTALDRPMWHANGTAGEDDPGSDVVVAAHCLSPSRHASHSELSIAPGDGARVDGTISLPREGLRGSVLPVIVADARYRLPDGSEGRTHASFAVGLPSGDGLAPFAVDLPSGLRDDVEARLHGEPERV